MTRPLWSADDDLVCLERDGFVAFIIVEKRKLCATPFTRRKGKDAKIKWHSPIGFRASSIDMRETWI